MKTTILLTIEHKKPLPDITDVICQRVWPYGGGCITDMTASLFNVEPHLNQPMPAVSEFDDLAKEAEAASDWEEAKAWAAEYLASLQPAKKPGFWARVWSRA